MRGFAFAGVLAGCGAGIKEAIVSGDMAVVRLVWTARVFQGGSGQVVETWRISPYMACEAS